MLQVTINRRHTDGDWSFFRDFGLTAEIREMPATAKIEVLTISNDSGEPTAGDQDSLYEMVITPDEITMNLNESVRQDVLGAVLVAVKRYRGKIILGDNFVEPQQAWAALVKRSQETKAYRVLLEKHEVLPVDVLAKLKPGAAMF